MDNYNANNYSVYKDISTRTNGEVYIGVVGPVRTGKSTFIKRFMDMLVLPGITDEPSKQRAMDELPQSATGKTIMTTEPKFIPKEAATVNVTEDIDLKVRLIDCVGYMVDGATGHMEDDTERMVKTPWFDYEIPFTKAAEIGTKKVINDHSTIGVVITTDGSFGDIGRNGYVEAEKRTIDEMRKLNKPYIVLLNSSRPNSSDTIELAKKMSEEYKTQVLPINCDQLKKNDITEILEALLLEFPIAEVAFNIPKWLTALDNDNYIKKELINIAKDIMSRINVIRDIYMEFPSNDYVEKIKLDKIDMDKGKININIDIIDKFYYEMLSNLIGEDITNEYQFVGILKNMAKQKSEYDQVANAIDAVKYKGYGAVTPNSSDIKLDKPEIIKHGNKYGVKIKAEAPSIHMIKANITTEIAPIVGTEEQANDLIEYINSGSQDGMDNMWNVNIFGKTLEQLVEEGIRGKSTRINEESQLKLQDTMEKIVNDSNGGMVCIII